MAVVDILANVGDGQDFILEIPVGVLGTPNDVLLGEGKGILLNEIPVVTSAGSNIFIMSD